MINPQLKNIPVNVLPAGIGEGIVIVRIAHDGKPNFMEVERSHRDSGYTFILQEKGITHIEIDFQIHTVQAPALIYIHPNQVHRLIEFEQAVISSWIITAENLQPEYFQCVCQGDCSRAWLRRIRLFYPSVCQGHRNDADRLSC